jgi:antiviral helicase SLH1
MNRPTFLAIKSHSPDKPVIVFVASRRQTRLTAKDLINFCGMEDNPRRFLRMSEDDLNLNLSRVKDEALRESLSFGIGLHHAGLVESDRQLSEELFANNKIQILVATSTLAWGVNLPAHLVVVKGTQFFDAKLEGYKDMDLTDVLQMLGRAGRPQFDTSGIARIFTQDSKKAFYKHFLHTGFPVESSLHNVLDNHLAAEISAETITTKQDALDYLTWTFFFRRLHKNPSYYGLEISAEEHNTVAAQELANEYMVELVEKSLKELEQSGCVIVHTNGDVDSTPLGKIMSYYYLSHKTIRHLRTHAKQHATFEDVLSWISCATEYDELPVRHNEDLINAELSKNLPLKADPFGLPMWDPHVKSFLLLQAHFSRIDLPISDYVGDLNSVLDQSIRIVQASIDVLTELGYLSSCEMMVTLLQCIKSARWPDDGPLSICPGVDAEAEKQRIADTKATPRTLVEASTAPNTALEKALRQGGVFPKGVPQAFKAIEALPNLHLRLSTVNAATIGLQIVRLNPPPATKGKSTEIKMFAPRFPKPQTEGFFVTLSYAGRDEVVALRRVGWQSEDAGRGKNKGSSQKQATTRITLPEELASQKLDLTVYSDGYIGMKWTLEDIEIPERPKVEDGGKGKERAAEEV